MAPTSSALFLVIVAGAAILAGFGARPLFHYNFVIGGAILAKCFRWIVVTRFVCAEIADYNIRTVGH